MSASEQDSVDELLDLAEDALDEGDPERALALCQRVLRRDPRHTGALFVEPGINVAFYRGDPRAGGTRLGVAKTTTRLDPGRYEVEATLAGSTLKQTVEIHAGNPTRTLFLWPAGTDVSAHS